MEYDAKAYFKEAFMAESYWGNEDMFCYKLFEFATGADADFLGMLEECVVQDQDVFFCQMLDSIYP